MDIGIENAQIEILRAASDTLLLISQSDETVCSPSFAMMGFVVADVADILCAAIERPPNAVTEEWLTPLQQVPAMG